MIRKGKAHPAGIVAAPVGFVHVQESKHMVKPFTEIPKIIVEGRKGGSNLAATLVNSVLCYNDAEQLRPGRSRTDSSTSMALRRALSPLDFKVPSSWSPMMA